MEAVFSVFSPTTVVLLSCVVAMAAFHYSLGKKLKNRLQHLSKSSDVGSQQKDLTSVPRVAPGPKPLPIIGNLHHLAKFEDNPYVGFTELAQEYGSVYSLKMGTTPALVVSSSEGFKEVLISKGAKFDGRPDFHRWNLYFDGDRQQSLALCDWSDLQKTRRSIIRSFLLMKSHSSNHESLDKALMTEMESLMAELNKNAGSPVMAKVPIQWCAMNVFLQYMCDLKFDYSEAKFRKVVNEFDLIFEDINNGHPTDFLPWLSPLFGRHLKNVKGLANNIRSFILKEIIEPQMNATNPDKTKNVLEGLLSNHLNTDGQEVSMDWSNMLFALEDLLGGSSAIGNVMLRILAMVSQNPDVQKKLQAEVDEVVGSDTPVSIDHRSYMPFTEATITEVLRLTSSPIVPHVANESTSLAGFDVQKGTVVFLNNYALNMSTEFWDEPESFKPERFIKNGQFSRPAHFLPFSTGKRACVGSKILMHVCFVTLVNIVQKFSISVPTNEDICLPVGKLAVIGDGFNLVLNHRR
ncbi:Cytochrome P450 CYP307A2 [Hyalella azteca]|uniref:Cytochrome P450 307a1 n=1 Tax=Hyalella azteca TaxID=294128 RepID=A0A6A0GPK7_HYAAZ|nr:cytochrome P450 307a1 [Hyalella azteca]KAA0183894.1 Cytochrome P450 CYP307A2 [Hyalella azteca]